MQDDSEDVISSIAPRVVTVGNFDAASTTKKDVLSFSSPYGKVDDVHFWTSNKKGRSFVFITYSTKREAAAAVSELSAYDAVFPGSDGCPIQFHGPAIVKPALLNSLQSWYDREVAHQLISKPRMKRHRSSVSPTPTSDDGEIHEDEGRSTASGSVRSHPLSLQERLGIKADPEAIDELIASALVLPDPHLDLDSCSSPPVSETVVVGAVSPRSQTNSSISIVPSSLPAVHPPKEPFAMRNRSIASAHSASAFRRQSSDVGLIKPDEISVGEQDNTWKSMCEQAEIGAADFKRKWEEAEQQARELRSKLEKAQTTSEIVPHINAEDIPKLQTALEVETKQRHALALELDVELRKRKRADDLLVETEEDVRRLRHQLESEHRHYLSDMDAIRLSEAARAADREERLVADVERLRRQVASQSWTTKNLEAELSRNRDWRNDLREELKDLRESRDAVAKERDAAVEREQALSQEVKRLHAVVEVAKQIEDLVARARQRVADAKTHQKADSKEDSEAASGAIQQVTAVADLSVAT